MREEDHLPEEVARQLSRPLVRRHLDCRRWDRRVHVCACVCECVCVRLCVSASLRLCVSACVWCVHRVLYERGCCTAQWGPISAPCPSPLPGVPRSRPQVVPRDVPAGEQRFRLTVPKIVLRLSLILSTVRRSAQKSSSRSRGDAALAHAARVRGRG